MFPMVQRRIFQSKKKCTKWKATKTLMCLSPLAEYKKDCGMCGNCEDCECISYGAQLSGSLKTLRDVGELCDGSLCTEDGFELKIHSFLICAASPVFRAVFKNGGVWKVTLMDVTPEVLRILVDFAYTGSAYLKEDNIKAVLCSGTKYMLINLVRLCESFMKRSLTISTCVRYMNLATRYNLTDLETEARRFLLWNWTQVWQDNKEFQELITTKELSSLLEDDMLNIESEAEIQRAVIKWIEYDSSRRSDKFSNLISKSRFDMRHNNRPSSVLECLADKWIGDRRFPSNFFRSRVPRGLLFSIGGWCCGSATCDIEVYDCKAGLWILSPHIDDVPRAYQGVCVVGGLIYLIGGYNGYECYRSVRSFEPVMRAWNERNSMTEARCYVSVVVLDDLIYAIGGFDGEERKASCERYDSSTNQWTMIASMKHVRSDASAAAYNGKIFCCGGYNGDFILSSIEVYDPEDNKWTEITDLLPEPRSGHRLIEFRYNLYLLGGYNGSDRVDKTYRYSQIQGQWIEDVPMISPRSNFGATEFEGQLYVIGGFDGRTIIPTVECYDPDEHVWVPVSNLNIPRSALAACVVEDIPNARRYSANGPYGKMTLSEYDHHLRIG